MSKPYAEARLWALSHAGLEISSLCSAASQTAVGLAWHGGLPGPAVGSDVAGAVDIADGM